MPHSAPASAVARPTSLSRLQWLLFVHQLPAQDSNVRVRTWRRLQQIGALPVKQSVYVLPDNATSREQFEWLKAELSGAGGEATIFVSTTVDDWSSDAIVDEFRRTRQEAYAGLAVEVEKAIKAAAVRGAKRRPLTARLLSAFNQRLSAIEQLDFFGSAGRDAVAVLLERVADAVAPRSTSTGGNVPTESYDNRRWVTRPRPGVDRMASAWLIRRFIDPAARFEFSDDTKSADAATVSFDMFGGTFTHRDQLCTFEVLRQHFALADAALEPIAALVHDLDLGDGRFGSPDAPTVGRVIEGLQQAFTDDHLLLEQGMVLFDALYRTATQAHRHIRPRPVARPRSRRTTR